MKQNIILDLCGGTGSWSEPFRKIGFKVIVLDIKDGYDITKFGFYHGELSFGFDKEAIWINPKKVFGIFAAPPCTHFSFARTKAKVPRDLENGMEIVEACLKIIWICQNNLKKDTQKKSHLKFWALENPNGMLKWFLGKPAFVFNPYDFGDNYKKKTHIWGDFNEPKKKDKFENLKEISGAEGLKSLVKFDRMLSKDIHPEYYGKLTRQERRGITPQGFAKAFMEAQI